MQECHLLLSDYRRPSLFEHRKALLRDVCLVKAEDMDQRYSVAKCIVCQCECEMMM